MFAGERVFHHHWDVCRITADAMENKIHAAKARNTIDELDAPKLLGVKKSELFLIELVVIADEIVRDEQKAARAACRIADNASAARTLGRLRLHDIDDCPNERTRSEVLTCAAFHVGIERRPFFLVDQVRDQPAQLSRVLDFILCLSKDYADQSRFFAEFFERVAIMNLEFVAV